MTKQDLQNNILNQPYNLEKWQEVLKRVFGATKLHQIPQAIAIASNDIAESAAELGSFYTKDEMLVGIYQIIIKDEATTDITKSKVGLRNLLRNVYKYDVDGALIVFVQGNKWRFSYVSEIKNRDGEIVTEPKRYTYLFGENEVCRTAADRFSKLIDKKYYLQDLYDAFSVEKLTKEFFTKYIEFYKKGVKHIIENKEYYNLLFDKSVNELEIDENKKEDLRQKPMRDFVKKLLGRIVFLHFLQKKEWLGCPVYKTKKENDEVWIEGSKTFIIDLFKQFPDKDNFHSQCLSVLFFETLNEKRTNNVFPLSVNNQQVRIPYLNGGLFDTDFKDPKTNLPLEKLIDFPVDYFQSLLDFFEQYNFTIDENDPYETEVGIDPEMLGHIFENLLEDNRERGAFYTPKEIVHYMCQESLIEYLKTNATALKKNKEEETVFAIENLVRNNRIDEIFTNKETAKHLDALLKNVKVCDPAIGSGAFPMGMLKEIFECRRVLYPYLKTNEEFSPSKIKKEIILENIYGVDLEGGAVDIARLRFWLALVVDELIPEPLPNLDYKIMQGNSLLERFEMLDLSKVHTVKKSTKIFEPNRDIFGKIINSQLKITDVTDDTILQENDLQQLMKEYFLETDPIIKADKKQKINKTIHDHIDYNLEFWQNELTIKIADAPNLNDPKLKLVTKRKIQKFHTELNELQSTQRRLHEIEHKTAKPYFLWHLLFKEVFDDGGFDIVIGNPPYIQLQKMGADALALEKANFSTYSKASDIYCLFYELGNNLLKKNGVLSYITSNNWMRTKYGELLRKYFFEETNPIKLINFEDTKIFQTATVETNILIFKKNKYEHNLIALAVKPDYDLNLGLVNYFLDNYIEITDLNNDDWVIQSKSDYELVKLIKINKPTLKDFDLDLHYGIRTGLNEVFIVDGKTKNEIIGNNLNNENAFGKLLRGRDLTKYGYQFKDQWLILSKHKGNEILLNEYPDVYNWLSKFHDQLKNRGQVKYGQHHWIELDNGPTDEYLNYFNKEKLIWIVLSDKPKFVFDNKGFYTNDSCFIMNGDNLKFICAIINSKISEWYFDKIATSSGVGTTMWKKYKLEKLPIPIIDDKNILNKVERLVDYLIYLNDNTQLAINPYTDNASIAPVFEDVVNMMVYELYFTQHMQELEIDVLQFIETENHFKPIDTTDNANREKNAEIIGSCYKWLQEQSNPIRNRIILSNIKSTDIIRRINSTTH